MIGPTGARSAGHSGLVAVVTGASRGLGAGLAGAFADHGMRLGLCARTRPVVPDGVEAVSRSVDVTDASAVDRFGVDVIDEFGRIDLWINNAGVLAPIGQLADADPLAVREHLDINVMGVVHGTASFARHVRTRPGGGVLINISSGAATKPYEGWGPYCGSKAAVEMITEVVAREEQSHGLRCAALSPGAVDTDMQSLIRSTPVEKFPSAERFHRMHEEDGFNSATWVARFILEELVDRDLDASSGVAQVRLRVPDDH